VMIKIVMKAGISMVGKLGNQRIGLLAVFHLARYGNSTAQLSRGGMAETICRCRKNSAKRR
jgi:hypothetical protein